MKHFGPDTFYNYDFDKKDMNRPDMPVNLVFWGAARTPDQVKIYTIGTSLSDPMYMRINQGRGFIWDEDSGSKDGTGLCYLSTHYRVYKDDSTPDVHFTTKWGFYIIGTSHRDNNEACVHGKWAGKAEEAEHRIADHAATIWGRNAIRYDSIKMYNPEGTYKKNGHYYQNDGKATAIKVCLDRNLKNIVCVQGPPNDDFADAQTFNRPTAGTLTNATVEPAESLLDRLTWKTNPTRTVWYRWTSPHDPSDNGCGYTAPGYFFTTVTRDWAETNLELTAWMGSDYWIGREDFNHLRLAGFGQTLYLPPTPDVIYYLQVADAPVNSTGDDFTIWASADVRCE